MIDAVPAPGGSATRFVQAFAEGWDGPHPERLLALLDPQIRLVQPLFPTARGRDAAEAAIFGPMFRFLPDLRLEIDRWSATDDTILIEWTGHATLAGTAIRWSGVDRFTVCDGRALERVAYFDALPLVVTILRHPSCWLAFLRSGMGRYWRQLLAPPVAHARGEP